MARIALQFAAMPWWTTLLPILEGASIEEDEAMVDRWAALLANASAGLTDELLPSFSAILRELSPAEAELLDSVYSNERYQLTPDDLSHLRWSSSAMAAVCLNLHRFNLLDFRYETMTTFRREDAVVDDSVPVVGAIVALPEYLIKTPLGQAFIDACRSPEQQLPNRWR